MWILHRVLYELMLLLLVAFSDACGNLCCVIHVLLHGSVCACCLLGNTFYCDT